MVQDRERGIWGKGEETTEGYYTLTDPLSERFLTATSVNELILEGIVKYLFHLSDKTNKLISILLQTDQNKYGLWGLFEPLILSYNHRQGESSNWANVLNRFREGLVTDEDLKLLQGKVTDEPHIELDSMHIVYPNQEAQNINDSMLNKLSSELILNHAGMQYPKGRKPKISPDGRVEERAILKVLKLKVGARCVLTSNLDTSDDLVNGACGTIRALEMKNNIVHCIVVEFDNEVCGKQHRARNPGLSNK